MKIETTKRRVHIEIIDHTQVRITNALRQKTFSMKDMVKDGLKIDLVSLSLTNDSCKFYAFVYHGSGVVGDPYTVHVALYNKSTTYGFGVIDKFKIGEQREGTVEVTVIEEDE